MDPVAELVERSQIQQLAFRYALAVDTCDRDALLAVFHPDAQLSTWAPAADAPFDVRNGHDEIGEIPRLMRERFTRTMHLMSNHLVDLPADTTGTREGGDEATGTVYCTARHLVESPVGGTDLVVVIRYEDRYRRTSEGWRIVDRRIRFQWSETHAVLTAEQSVMS